MIICTWRRRDPADVKYPAVNRREKETDHDDIAGEMNLKRRLCPNRFTTANAPAAGNVLCLFLQSCI